MQEKLTAFTKKNFLLIALASSIGMIVITTKFFLPNYINIDQYRSKILSEINNNPKYQANIGKLNLTINFLGQGIITTDTAMLFNKRDKKTVFSAKNLSINISLLPLLQKHLEINHIKANNLELILKIKGKSGMELKELFDLSKLKGPFKPVFTNTSGYIDKYRITLIDHISNRSIIFDGNDFELIKYIENKYIALKTSGIKDKKTQYKIYTNIDLPFKKNITDNNLAVNANIKDLSLSELSYYTDYKNIKGIINLDSELLLHKQNLSIKGQAKVINAVIIPKYNLTIPPGTVNLNSILSNSQINIKGLSVLFDGIKSSLKGTIINYKSQNPELKLNVLINNFQPSFLNNFFITTNSPINRFIKKYKGSISGNLSIFGQRDMPKAKGTLSFKGPSGFLLGDIKLNNSQLQFLNNKINIENQNSISISGGLDFYNKTFSDLKIQTAHLNLSNLHKELTSFSEVLPKVQQRLKNINIDGNLDLNIVLNGNVNHPEIFGSSNLSSLNIKNKNFKGQITNTSAQILFNKSNILIKNLLMNINKSGQINITGNYDFKKQYINQLVIDSRILDIAELQELLINFIPEKKILTEYLLSGKVKPSFIINGNVKKPSYKGTLLISKAQILDKKTLYGLKNISGTIKLDNSILINNISGSFDNNPIKINGKIFSKDNGEIFILVNNFKVNSFREFLLKFKLPKPKDIAFLQKALIQGSVSGNMDFKITKNKIIPSSQLTIKNISITHPDLIDKIVASKGILKIQDDTFSANNVLILLKSSSFLLNGTIHKILTNKTNYDISIKSKNVNYDLLKSLTKSNHAPEKFKDIVNAITEVQGKSGIDFKISNNKYNLTFDMYKIGFKIPLLPKNLENISGQISFTPENILVKNFNVNYGHSKIGLNSKVTNYNKSAQLALQTKGNISLFDFNEFFADDIKQNIICTEPAAFEGKFDGSINNWRLNLYSNLPSYSEIGIKGLFRKPKDTSVNLSTDISSSQNKLNIDKFLIELDKNQINAKGNLIYSIENFLEAEDLSFSTPVFDISNLNQFIDPSQNQGNLSGIIDTNIKINGPIFSPNVSGFINLNKITLPGIQVNEISSNIQLAEQHADINNLVINLNDIIFEINSHIENIFSLPLQLSKFNISSPSIRLNKFLALDLLKYPPLFTPIIIKDGRINFKEAIIDKLITTNMTGNLIFCENGLLQFNNLSMETAKGTTKGNIYFNPIDGSVGAQLKVVSVKANAAATILLNMPNEIFGDLNAIIMFDSKGLNYEDMLKNAEGKAFLFIRDGRFTRLGNLEHLLTATNIFQGGIKRLSLNNIIAGLIPIHTGYFELLNGEFNVKEGILSTDNLTSRGKNLSLELKGNYNIATEYADLMIKGHMSRTVSGILGPLGKLNIGTITNLIPGIGFIPGVKRRIGLLDLIPGLGFLPGFGRSKHDKIRNFAVDIKGKLYEQSSLKNFRWIEE